MKAYVTAILITGERVRGLITTEHAASSYGQPVYVDLAGRLYDWSEIASLLTGIELARMGGSRSTERKRAASRANGRLGGRPRKAKIAS